MRDREVQGASGQHDHEGKQNKANQRPPSCQLQLCRKRCFLSRYHPSHDPEQLYLPQNQRTKLPTARRATGLLRWVRCQNRRARQV